MKTHAFLFTAAAGVVAATFLPPVAHALRATPGSAEPRADVPQETPAEALPEGTRALAPPAGGSKALRRGAVPEPAAEPAQEPGPDVASLLSEPDLEQRERNFDDVVVRALDAPDVRAALEALAAGTDVELAWTARLALREVRATQPSGPRTLAPFGRNLPFGGGGALRGHDPFQALESWLGRDPFDDPFFARPFGGRAWPSPFQRGPLGQGGARAGEDLFERMRAELEELERMFATPPTGVEEGDEQPLSPPAPQGGVRFQGRSEQLSVTPEGVRLEVTEDGPQGRTTRTYEAETLEELYSAHPELRPRGR